MSTITEQLGGVDRRTFLRGAAAFLALLAGGRGLAHALGSASTSGVAAAGGSNFRRIYQDTVLRDRFFLFLQNVFHLYPEEKFHELIIELVAAHETDREIYEGLLDRLPRIKPTLGALTYAVPALRKQKTEMTNQALQYLGTDAKIDGCVEVGSPGRYVSELRHHARIDGPVWVVNDVAPTYGPIDVLERGQVGKLGTWVPMGNYDPIPADVPDGGADVVLNFIGFHHCPPERLEGFVASIRRVLRPGGRLLLRDHDAGDEEMATLVALAHDVFNAGLLLPWEENSRQVRLFRPIDGWTRYLRSQGFRASDRTIAQAHDPTRNLLVELVKV